MLFSSPFFMFAFFPIFFLIFLGTRGKYRNYILLAGSILFYFWGEPSFCIIALASATLDYWLCKLIYHAGVQSKKAKRYMIIGIFSNLLLLLYYKYINFFLVTLLQLMPGKPFHFDLFNIILPIGISFIVFEKITYLVDVYRGVGKPANGILSYLNYVFLFPKLLAGPIIKYHEIESQLQERKIASDEVAEGFKRFLRGLAKKVFIADSCGQIVNQIFALSSTQLGFGYAWLGIACFTLQIYFDFSGYSDMALGLARMLGFTLRENFNMPYIARNFTEFWRRWHISLSTWIREYLYIPLGGSRVTQARCYINLWICFLLSGLWHGANWTFVLWGAYNGLFLVLDKLFWLRISEKLPNFLQVFITLLLVMLGWVVFRANNFTQMQYYFSALLHPSHISQAAYVDVTADIITAMLIGAFLILLPMLPRFSQWHTRYLSWEGRIPLEGVLFGTLGFFCLSKIVGASYTPFLYFKF